MSEPSTEQILTVSAGNGSPETFYFTFEQINDRVLAFGRMDTDEIENMRNEVLFLNREQNNLLRKLHKTNSQLTQKKKALSQSLSDLKMAQAKLVESEKMASLGRLVAGFAHEINTPVGIALTASSSILESSRQIDHMLTQDEVEEDDLISALESIRDASKLVFSNLKRSADLVGSFKRTSIDQSFDNLSEYCLNETIEDVLTSMRIKIKNAPVDVVFNWQEIINLYGNSGDIFQVISNLFENSLLHGFENGTLDGEICVSVQKEANSVLIRYSDTGKGMSSETAERIFEPFFTTLRAKGGTGLGMYICHNIVTSRLNGTIECSSMQGQGTTFLITVPITKEAINEVDKIKK
nr:HAMP domain-containing sensor histidine kinase [uncultured Desulfobacter sp.]